MSSPLSHNPTSRPPDRPGKRPDPPAAPPPSPTAPAPEGDSAAISQLRSSLIRALRTSPQSLEPLCDALELLEGLQQRLETKRHPDAQESAPASSGRARRGDRQEYIIQRTGEGDFLTERRPGGSQPFRCPRDAYDAAAGLVAGAGEPLHFDELLERLNRAMQERQADYRLRVCLRFWAQQQLIRRIRTRYRASDAARFERDAAAAWEALASERD